ncbi:hypothetical protein JW865_07090 [Candidatus Bathyarchaeota archaeon]|nr:hypothetical protein [Candidatus Bathyarchaeota archaeon]
MTEIVPYNDDKHKNQFIEMNIEYLTWVLDGAQGSLPLKRHEVIKYVEEILPKFTEAKPPDGIVYIIELDGKMVGMGALR